MKRLERVLAGFEGWLDAWKLVTMQQVPRTHDEHAAASPAHHLLSDRAEHPTLETLASMRSEHDEIGIDAFCQGADAFTWCTVRDIERDALQAELGLFLVELGHLFVDVFTQLELCVCTGE